MSRRLPLTIGALVIVLAGCGESPSPPPQGPLPVSVVAVTPADLPQFAVAPGQVEGVREVEVRARVTGILQAVDYREGAKVRAGDILFRIDPAPYEAALALAKAQLRQEEARATQARAEAARLERLLAAKAAGQKETEDSLAAAAAAEASRDAAAARVRLAELDLGYCELRSPIDGVAGRRLRTEGTLVTQGGPDALLTTVVQSDEVWVRFGLSEAEFARLYKGAASAMGSAVRVIGPDGKPGAAAGKVDFVAPGVDTRLGNIQLRARFPNADGSLLPGQFLRVQVEGLKAPGACRIPEVALVQTPAGRSVFVAADGKAEARVVEVGGVSGGQVDILGGLREGDRVIVDQLQRLRPGVPVAPRAPAAK
jgi:membrane fusion protein, multidrug efflux system